MWQLSLCASMACFHAGSGLVRYIQVHVLLVLFAFGQGSLDTQSLLLLLQDC